MWHVGASVNGRGEEHHQGVNPNYNSLDLVLGKNSTHVELGPVELSHVELRHVEWALALELHTQLDLVVFDELRLGRYYTLHLRAGYYPG